MNTPAHAVFNLLALSRRTRPHRVWPVSIGAVLPDVPMFVFYFWERHVMDQPPRWIWSTGYHLPSWQAFFDSFNSIPLLGLALGFVLWRGRTWWAVLFASMLIHSFTDLATHHDDAHRHFFPFSEWRFASPVSYWDGNHYGRWFAAAELLLVLAGSLVLIHPRQPPASRLVAAGILALYILFLAFAISAWG